MSKYIATGYNYKCSERVTVRKKDTKHKSLTILAFGRCRSAQTYIGSSVSLKRGNNRVVSITLTI